MDHEQGSEAWRQARIGKLTASRFHEAVAKTKTGWGSSRDKYMWDLIVERLTGQPKDGFVTYAMQFGIDNEPKARAAYEFYCEPVTKVGFIDHPNIRNSGASPDGLVGTDGLVEIKVPDSATHGRTLLGEPISVAYEKQMQWQMACTGRAWCDYVSYDPRVPERYRLKIIRVRRDATMIAEMEHEARRFLAELEDKLFLLRNLPDQRAA